MTFAALPLWALGAIAGAVMLATIALYLLRRTPRPAVVSSVALWLRAAQKSQPKVLRATRIPWLSLLVSLLVGALLVMELGDPRFGRGVRGTTVVVLSTHLTMGAREGRTTRLELARNETRDWVERATARGRVAVVRAGIVPRVLLPLTENARDLDRAFEGLRADDGAADLDAAVRLADAIVAQSGEAGQIVVVADQIPSIATRAPQVLVPVGGVEETVAIDGFSARRDPLAVGEYAVVCDLHAYTTSPASGRLVIRDRDTVIENRAFALRPGESLRVMAQGFSSAQGELVARLERVEIGGRRDALAADDVAYAVAAPLHRTRVLLATPGNRWLERVLAVHGAVDLEKVSPDALPSGAALARFDVVIVDRSAVALEHPALLAIAPRGTGSLRNPRITAVLAAHEAVRGVRLADVRVRRARAVELETGDQVLLRSGANALAIARETPAREGRPASRRIELGFDLDSTDLVQRLEFPLFMHSALHWLAGARDEDDVLGRRLGAPLIAGNSAVLGPDGHVRHAHEGIVDDTFVAGLYHVGERAVPFGVPGAAGALRPAVSTLQAPPPRAVPPLGVLVGGALVMLVLLEWFLLHRGRLT